jgi:tetratricopeptide (TPR) repeat protein
MHKEYIGQNRAENLAWLLDTWLTAGPPICFLEGFPGVGKSDLAQEFREAVEKSGQWEAAVAEEVPDRAMPSVGESFLDISVGLANQGLTEMEQILLGETNPNLPHAVEKSLKRRVVIVLDEAQRFFSRDSGSPLPELILVLSYLRNRSSLPGRLLLLSDRKVERARWSESFPIRTLDKLSEGEAEQLFDLRLATNELADAVPAERKRDLVRALDCNPRAIEALVSALAYEPLDEIIGRNPDLWDVSDREVSREFVERLERDMLERTMSRLDNPFLEGLLRLAVHRKGFQSPAIKIACGGREDEFKQLREALVTRFLMNHRAGWHSLNPIVREISLARLKDRPSDFNLAHSYAADYHLRHFQARTITGGHAKLGASFAELRYHLFHSGHQDKLREVIQRFTDYLKQEIKSVSPVPGDREELDERIGALSVLLEEEGAKGLEYHLARCLQSRGRPGDLQKAVFHAARATGAAAPSAAWILRAKLEAQVNGVDAGMRIVSEALRKMNPDDALADVFGLGARILSGAGRVEEAIELLRQGIKLIPADKNLFSLYKSCAELLGRANRNDEAIELLRQGIRLIPADKGLSSLYPSCAELLSSANRNDEAIELLRQGIRLIPADKGLSSLYPSCAELLGRANRNDEAIELLRQGIEVIPAEQNLSSLYHSCAELLSGAGRTDEAIELLHRGIRIIPVDKGRIFLYEVYAIHLLRDQRPAEAVGLLKEALTLVPEGLIAQSTILRLSESLAAAGNPSEAINLLKRSIAKNPSGSTPLYIACGEMLSDAGRTDEAIELLRQGIKVIPADKSLFSLYHSCTELLSHANRNDEAIELLRQGIKVIPADKNLAALYQQLAVEFCRVGAVNDAITTLREGYIRIPSRFNGHSLFDVAQALRLAVGGGVELQKAYNEISDDTGFALQAVLSRIRILQNQLDWKAAAEIAAAGRSKFPNNYTLAAQEAFSRLAEGDAEGAHDSLSRIHRQAKISPLEFPAWLMTFIYLRQGAMKDAEQSLAAFLGRPVNRAEELSEQFLLRVWDGQVPDVQTQHPCFHFPLLPPSLTGLSHEVRRVQFSDPVLPSVPSTQPSVSGASCFISYAWGDESEEIANELDKAFQTRGVTIVRDKRDLEFKGRIKEFMETIGQGKAVILVISEKYLKSPNCLFELSQVAKHGNFAGRVFPVVLNDARIYDPIDRLRYVQYWEQKQKEFTEALKTVDPANLHGFREDIDLYSEIRATLPSLTDVLRDMNTLTTAIHRKSDFDELFKAVMAKLSE